MQVLPAPGTRERPPHERARGGRAGAHRVADPGLQRPSHERHCHAPVETGHLRTEGAQVLGWGTRLACVSMLLFTAGLEGALVRYGSQRGGAHPLIPQYVREAVPRGAVRVHWAVLQPDLHGIKRVAAAAQTPSQSVCKQRAAHAAGAAYGAGGVCAAGNHHGQQASDVLVQPALVRRLQAPEGRL